MQRPQSLAESLAHWPEFLMEAAGLGIFMISACTFGVLLEHPQSPVPQLIENAVVRRALMGIAMGLTAISIIRSPWGQRSGAHLNPAVTLTFLSLAKVGRWDALFYVLAQFAGGWAGVRVAGMLLGLPLEHSSVNWVMTLPGGFGERAAWAAEAAISFFLMMTVLVVSNTRQLARFTPYFAGTLVALYILFEAPVSGMSMNPARSFGSAAVAGDWTAIWIYFTAPLPGMLLAAFVYRHWRGVHRVYCAKLHHHNAARCIFRCRFGEM